VALTEQQLTVNAKGISGVYCDSSLSYAECVTLMGLSSVNQGIMEMENVSTSFRCLVGTCQEVSHLWDYFWTHKLRFDFIDYILLGYQSNGSVSALLVPSLAV
jgi:hypothetical protein